LDETVAVPSAASADAPRAPPSPQRPEADPLVGAAAVTPGRHRLLDAVRHVFSADADGYVAMWDLVHKCSIFAFKAHASKIVSMNWSAQSHTLMTASEDCTHRVICCSRFIFSPCMLVRIVVHHC
jgi:hypothetical protein